MRYLALSLTIFACGLIPHALVNVNAGEADKSRVNDSRVEQWDSKEESRVEGEDTVEVVGKWRNNGGVLEPKWRDGDTVPLQPFPSLPRSRPTLREENDTPRWRTLNPRYEYEDYDGGPRRRYKDQEDGPRRRTRPAGRLYPREKLRVVHRDEEARNTPSRLNLNTAASSTLYEITKPEENENPETKDNTRNRKEENSSPRYREIFSAHPNAYEQELNDEEYLKPRPRKRRPPQNYEFALAANEAQRQEKRGQSTIYRPWNQPEEESSTETGPKLELKSLLKMQQEGLSLSEVLQRKNLSLTDLLKGKADVISVLKSKDIDEIDEDIEEVSRVMSNSLMKLSTTAFPDSSSQLPVDKSTKNRVLHENTDKIFLPTEIPALIENSEIRVNRIVSTDRPYWMTTMEVEKADESAIAETLETQSSIGRTASTIVSNREENATEASIETTARTSTSTERPFTITLGPLWVEENIPEVVKRVTTTTEPTFGSTDTVDVSQSEEVQKSDENARMKTELDEDEIMEFSDFPVFKKSDSKDEADTGSTLSIEHILGPTERTTIRNLPVETISGSPVSKDKIKEIDDTLIIGDLPADYNSFADFEYQDDTPGAANAQNENRTHVERNESNKTSHGESLFHFEEDASENHHRPDSGSSETLPFNHRPVTSKPYEDIVSEIEPEARAEIFELFASGSSGKRLERLLKSRNMSLEELIALRQRGSSKVHLAEVTRLNNETPTTPKITTLNYSNEGRNFKNSESSEINKTTLKIDSDDKFMEKLLEHFRSDKQEAEDRERSTIETIQQVKQIQISDLLTTFSSLPFDKDSSGRNSTLIEQTSPTDTQEETTRENENSSSIQTGFVEKIENEIPKTIILPDVFDETDEITINEEKRSLSRVRPSIIASGAILGVTIVVFLAILIACRVRQKQRYIYRNGFSRAVFQGPITAARKLSNSSSLSTVMVNVVATSTTKRPDRCETHEHAESYDNKSDIDNDSLDANDSWETIPDYLK